MRKIKPVWYVAMKGVLEMCVYRKTLKPLMWLFEDHFYETSVSNLRYFGRSSEYVKYCRRNHLAMFWDSVI